VVGVNKMNQASRLPLLALLTANTISYIGNSFAFVAIPWFVIKTTGSAVQIGLAGFSAALPLIIAGIFGGVIVDWLGYKRTSILSDLISGLTVALLPLLFMTIGLAFWQLLILVFLGALLDVPGGAARESLIPDLIKGGNLTLQQANSAFDMTRRLSTFIGAPLAGLIAASFGIESLLWLDAMTFGVSALMVAVLVPPLVKTAPLKPRRYLHDLYSGMQFISLERLLRVMIITFTLINFISTPFFSVILPLYADKIFGSAVSLGLMTAAAGGGAFLGLFFFGTIGDRFSRRTILVGVGLFTALRYGTLALYPPLAVSIGVIALTGLMFGPLNPMISSLIQECAPESMRGRIFGLLEAITSTSIPLGILLGGYLAEGFGLQAVLAGQAVFSLIITFYVLFQPAFQGLERR
jgi:MFS family permease